MPKPNLLFFLLDGVRPDRLRGCGGDAARHTFVDELLERGTLLPCTIAAGPYTLLALTSMFTGFYGGVHGVNGAYKAASDLHPEIVTLTDRLKQAGYSTLCFSGSPFEPMEPVHGFDLYRLAPKLDARVAHEYFSAPEPRFVSLSLQSVHDACCARPGEMTPENYDREVAALADELEELYRALVRPGDVVMVYSDHGMRLRERAEPDWPYWRYPEQEPTTGVYLSEHTIRSFACFLGAERFPARRITSMTRSIDLAPTLLDALGLPALGAQGRSLWPSIQSGAVLPEQVAFTETGGRWFSPFAPNVRAVRTQRYKLVRHDEQGEALYDLAVDPAEACNLIGGGHPEEPRLRELLDAQLRDNRRAPASFYEASGIDHRALVSSRSRVPVVLDFAKPMNAYEGACLGLAQADLDATRRHARDLRLVLHGLRGRTSDAGELAAFTLAAEHAELLSRVETLEEASARFARLSALFVAFVAQRPAFHASLVVYEHAAEPALCWLQKRNDALRVDPYRRQGEVGMLEKAWPMPEEQAAHA